MFHSSFSRIEPSLISSIGATLAMTGFFFAVHLKRILAALVFFVCLLTAKDSFGFMAAPWQCGSQCLANQYSQNPYRYMSILYPNAYTPWMNYYYTPFSLYPYYGTCLYCNNYRMLPYPTRGIQSVPNKKSKSQ